MPAAVPLALVFAAAATGYQTYSANQATQHAKGAAEAEQTAMNAQIEDAKKTTAADTTSKAAAGAGTQAAAIAALRASLSASSGMGGSILTTPQGAAPAPTTTKTLLGI